MDMKKQCTGGTKCFIQVTQLFSSRKEDSLVPCLFIHNNLFYIYVFISLIIWHMNQKESAFCYYNNFLNLLFSLRLPCSTDVTNKCQKNSKVFRKLNSLQKIIEEKRKKSEDSAATYVENKERVAFDPYVLVTNKIIFSKFIVQAGHERRC